MLNEADILVPNFKRRLSGVTSTIVRLVPIQARSMKLCATGFGLPSSVPKVSLLKVLLMSRSGPSGLRIWHARRNIEMVFGLILKNIFKKNWQSCLRQRPNGITPTLQKR